MNKDEIKRIGYEQIQTGMTDMHMYRIRCWIQMVFNALNIGTHPIYELAEI